MNDSMITNQYRAAAFFATLVGESDGFKYFEYRGSIGGQNDDSVYRGRGAIFIKGKQDYELASKALGNIFFLLQKKNNDLARFNNIKFF